MIAIGGDHSALELKAEIMAHLKKRGEVFEDFGTHTRESCDYPDIAKAVCGAILEGRCDRGILICGTDFHRGEPFSGNSGGSLQRLLQRAGDQRA